jgi:hypothetical protein
MAMAHTHPHTFLTSRRAAGVYRVSVPVLCSPVQCSVVRVFAGGHPLQLLLPTVVEPFLRLLGLGRCWLLAPGGTPCARA